MPRSKKFGYKRGTRAHCQSMAKKSVKSRFKNPVLKSRKVVVPKNFKKLGEELDLAFKTNKLGFVKIKNIITRKQCDDYVSNKLKKDCEQNFEFSPINFADQTNRHQCPLTILPTFLKKLMSYLCKYFGHACNEFIYFNLLRGEECSRQIDHYDCVPMLKNIRRKNYKQLYYSIILSIMPHTKIIIENKIVSIPLYGMLIFKGNVRHAGAAYHDTHYRVFIQCCNKTYPKSKLIDVAIEASNQ